MHRETLQKHAILFDKRVVPSFEDGHLINRLFLSSPNRTVSFVPNAKYFYRKRADSTSIIDKSKEKSSYFLDIIEFGFLDLLRTAKATMGQVPVYIQAVEEVAGRSYAQEESVNLSLVKSRATFLREMAGQ